MLQRFTLFRLTMILLVVISTFGISCKKYLEVEPLSSFGTDYVFDNVVNAASACTIRLMMIL